MERHERPTPRRRLAIRLLVITSLVGTVLVLVGAPTPAVASGVPASDGTGACLGDLRTETLNDAFARPIGSLVGMDSGRTYDLPGGRTLWLFQDAFIDPAGTGSLRPPTWLAHNAGLLQTGTCFEVLHGGLAGATGCGGASHAPLIGSGVTDNCAHWFWPLGGEMGADGMLHVFVAEMANPNATGAAPGAGAAAMWVARLDPSTLEVVSFLPAPDPSARILWGWSVASDTTHSYLFGYSYDQFVPPASSPSPSQVFVARVPLGRFDLRPEYWAGASWTGDAELAVAVIDGPADRGHGMQVERVGASWVGVTKDADWWGNEIVVEVAASPTGPWVRAASFTIPSKTADGWSNTYAPHVLPWRSELGNLVIGLSNNAWHFDPDALDSPWRYRPTFFEIDDPTGTGWAPSPAASRPEATPPVPLGGPPLAFTPSVPPMRALDTRLDGGRIAPGETRVVDLSGVTSAGAGAASLNLVTVDADAPGFLTAWPCDRPRPWTASVNHGRRDVRAAHAIVALAANRTICVFSLAETDVVVDVYGEYSPDPGGAFGYHPIAPQRWYDSREDTAGIVLAGEIRELAAPVGAAAVTVNLAVTAGRAAGWVRLYPCSSGPPETASVNFARGATVSNLVQVSTGDGRVCVQASAAVHVILDLSGTFAPDGVTGPGGRTRGLRYRAAMPTRLLDTRAGIGGPIGLAAAEAHGGQSVPTNVRPALGVLPDEAEAIVATFVAVGPRGAGWGVVTPCIDPGFPVPYGSASLNFTTGSVVANLVVAPTRRASGLDLCSFTLVSAHHVLDLAGWYVAA